VTFTAIVCSHDNDPGLRKLLGNLIYQTRKPDEILVFCSDPHDWEQLKEDFEAHVDDWVRCENRRDWGHEKRSQGVELATSDYLGFFNDDDSYAETYVEKMLAAAEGVEVAYCAWSSIPQCTFNFGSSTSGNFIVAREIAQQVGYQGRGYCADGEFIDALTAAGATAVKVDEILYFHNEQ
jgi:hypothetical protein